MFMFGIKFNDLLRTYGLIINANKIMSILINTDL